jgi:hypothetical protein
LHSARATLTAIGHLAQDVRWTVNASDRSATPWFGDYKGRRNALACYEALSVINLTSYDFHIIGDENVVRVWLQMEFMTSGRRLVEMHEVQVCPRRRESERAEVLR